MRRALRAVVTLAAAGVMGVAGAGAAQASAYGASAITPFTYTASDGATKSVPYGCALIHSISGEGVSITAQTATVDCAGWAAMRDRLFCDVRVVFTFTDTSGRTVDQEDDQLAGCRTLGIRLSNPEMPIDVEPGRACVKLYVNGEKTVRATSCHVISS